jgi:hypothetical protein
MKETYFSMDNLFIYVFDEVWSNPAQRKRIKYLGRVSKEKILQKNGARLRRRLLEQILCHHTQQSQVCEDYNTCYKKRGLGKGQLILKWIFGAVDFLQKTNKNKLT